MTKRKRDDRLLPGGSVRLDTADEAIARQRRIDNAGAAGLPFEALIAAFIGVMMLAFVLIPLPAVMMLAFVLIPLPAMMIMVSAAIVWGIFMYRTR